MTPNVRDRAVKMNRHTTIMRIKIPMAEFLVFGVEARVRSPRYCGI
jgi:hypothetical protein